MFARHERILTGVSPQTALIVRRLQPKARVSAVRRNLKEAGGKVAGKRMRKVFLGNRTGSGKGRQNRIQGFQLLRLILDALIVFLELGGELQFPHIKVKLPFCEGLPSQNPPVPHRIPPRAWPRWFLRWAYPARRWSIPYSWTISSETGDPVCF